MTTQHVRAVLDGQFHLNEIIGGRDGVTVFKAIHESGVDVVVKVVEDLKHFFDELARLSGCDESPYFINCLYHYPPSSVVNRELPIVWHGEPDLAITQNTGILVLEYVEGDTLDVFLKDTSQLERVDKLMEVAYALRELQVVGLSHGNLTPANVIVERETGEIKIIDLSPNATGTGPMLQDGGEPNFASDIYQVGRNLIPLLGRGWRIRSLLKCCTQKEPEDRPAIADLLKALKELRRKLMPRKNLEILFSFLKPVHVFTWVLVIGISSMAINLIGEKQAPVQKRRADLVNSSNADPTVRVGKLRAMLPEAPDEKFRELLIKDIAEDLISAPVKEIPLGDAAKPVAVFAFKHRPIVVTWNQIIELGDWVRIGERYGVVTEIYFNRMKLDYEGAFSWHSFDRPGVGSGLAYQNEVVILWNHPRNIHRLLSAVAEIRGIEFEAETNDLNGKVMGIFVANSINSFLNTIGDTVDLEINDKKLILHDQEDFLQVFYRFQFINLKKASIADLTELLSDTIGCKVIADPALMGEEFNLMATQMSWQEALQELCLVSVTRTHGDEKVVYITKPLHSIQRGDQEKEE